MDGMRTLRGELLEDLVRGAELSALLDRLVRGIEALRPGLLASIMIIDDTGQLSLAAAPSLPPAWCATIARVPVAEGAGSCGTAAFRRERIVVEDIARHPWWASCREAAADAGLAACWSQPVLDARGEVLAAFALYARTPAAPDAGDIALVTEAAALAGILIERKREERQLRIAMLAMETAGESIFWLDVDGRMLYVNPAAERELGYSAAELRRMRVSDIDPNVPPEVWGEDGALIRRLRAGGLRKFIGTHRHRDGHLIPVEIESDAFQYEGQHYSMAICRDISEREASERALRKSEAKFAALFKLTPTPMLLTRLEDGMLLEANRSFGEFVGCTPEATLGRSTLPGDLGLWPSAAHRLEWRARLEAAGELTGYEIKLQRADRSIATVLMSSAIVELDGERCVLSSYQDITDKKAHEKALELIAHHDALTGLPNRLLLADRLHQAIAQSQRAGTRVAVCYLDLDGFKAVNDTHGHEGGDRLLIEVARRLIATVRRGDTVARLGGDEFVLLLSGLSNDDECRSALERVLHVLATPFPLGGGRRASVSASIGVTLYPADHADPDTLIRHADHAMYAAKQAGKNRWQLFDTRTERRLEAWRAQRRRIRGVPQRGETRPRPKGKRRRG